MGTKESSLDFSEIRSAAIASLEGNTPDPSPTPDPTPSPDVVPAGNEPAKVATPAAEEVKKWKVKDNGEELEVDETELVNGHLRFRDYTRKTQTLAEERKAVEAQKTALSEREQKINALLSDAENVARYYEFLTGSKLTPAQAKRVEAGLTPTAGGGNPDEVATLKEAEQLAKTQADSLRQQIEQEMLEKLARTQQWTQEQIQQAQLNAEVQRNAAAYQQDIATTIDALATEHKILSDAYDKQELEDLLCKDVMRLEPKTLAEAKKFLIDAAKDRAERLERVYGERVKAAALQKGKLASEGIEPRGGSAPAIPAAKHKLGDKALTQSAIAYMESFKK